jgi:hypothetical protein
MIILILISLLLRFLVYFLTTKKKKKITNIFYSLFLINKYNMTFSNNLSYFNIALFNVAKSDDIIYFFIFLIIGIIGIILLAVPLSQILDTEADYQSRQVYKEYKPTIVVDLAYMRLAVPANSNVTPLFFYDKLDPSGVKMSSLFATSGYITIIHNGFRGYSGITPASLNDNNELPVVASPLGVRLIESTGGAILSNGVGIKKEVSLVRQGRSTTVTRLCVLENM